MLRSIMLTCSAVTLVVLTLGDLRAEEWPRFRGVAGGGVSDSVGLPAEVGPEQNVLWKRETAAGSSSPIITAGKLYLASYDNDDRIVQCFDAATGEPQWKQVLPKLREESTSRLNGPATCTPVTDGDNVVVFFPDTGLLCYSTTGDLRWRVDAGPFHSMHGISSSPVIAQDKVLVLADQMQNSFLAAYDLKTGALTWRQPRPEGITGGYSTPTILHAPDRSPLVLTSGPGGLVAYDLETGASVLSVPGIANAPVAIPLLSGTRAILCEPVGEAEPISLFLPHYDKNKDGKISFEETGNDIPTLRLMERIERGWGNGDEIVDAAEWNQAFQTFVDKGGLVAVDIADNGESRSASIAWNYRKGVPYVASPLLFDGLLYMVNSGGVITTVDPTDGSPVSEKRLRKGGKQFYASPVAADGKIYVVDTAGQLTVLQAGREWKELHTVDMEEPCTATPAICDGRIYLRTQEHLYCFGNSKSQ